MLFAFLVTLITLLHVKKQPNTANEKNDLTMESRRSNPKLPNGIKNYGTSGLEGTFFKNPKNMVSLKKKKNDFPTQPIESDCYGCSSVHGPKYGKL